MSITQAHGDCGLSVLLQRWRLFKTHVAVGTKHVDKLPVVVSAMG